MVTKHIEDMHASVMRKERIRRSWTLRQVAERLDISDEAVRLIETGQRKPGYEVLCKLEDLFGMDHRILFACEQVQ